MSYLSRKEINIKMNNNSIKLDKNTIKYRKWSLIHWTLFLASVIFFIIFSICHFCNVPNDNVYLILATIFITLWFVSDVIFQITETGQYSCYFFTLIKKIFKNKKNSKITKDK